MSSVTKVLRPLEDKIARIAFSSRMSTLVHALLCSRGVFPAVSRRHTPLISRANGNPTCVTRFCPRFRDRFFTNDRRFQGCAPRICDAYTEQSSVVERQPGSASRDYAHPRPVHGSQSGQPDRRPRQLSHPRSRSDEAENPAAPAIRVCRSCRTSTLDAISNICNSCLYSQIQPPSLECEVQ